MDINFFKQTRILDGGMGQELLARGMESNGTLWSANALLQEKYHLGQRINIQIMDYLILVLGL